MDLAGPWKAAFICLFTVEMYAQMRTVIESGLLNLFRLTENLQNTNKNEENIGKNPSWHTEDVDFF